MINTIAQTSNEPNRCAETPNKFAFRWLWLCNFTALFEIRIFCSPILWVCWLFFLLYCCNVCKPDLAEDPVTAHNASINEIIHLFYHPYRVWRVGVRGFNRNRNKKGMDGKMHRFSNTARVWISIKSRNRNLFFFFFWARAPFCPSFYRRLRIVMVIPVFKGFQWAFIVLGRCVVAFFCAIFVFPRYWSPSFSHQKHTPISLFGCFLSLCRGFHVFFSVQTAFSSIWAWTKR